MSRVNTEPGSAWTTLMQKLAGYGVKNPNKRFGEGGEDIGTFLDHWHGPYGSFEVISQALIETVAESQLSQRENP